MTNSTPIPYQTPQDARTTQPVPPPYLPPLATYQQAPVVHVHAGGRPEGGFQFDGGAGSYLLVGIGSVLVTVLSLGLALPWAIAMQYRWRTQHTIINGRRLRFTGSGGSLFGHWVKWFLLCIVTVGIYSFWVVPRITRWAIEHQDFA